MSKEHDDVSNQEESLSVLDKILKKSEVEINPWEMCVLPSRGVYYNGLIPNGTIEVKPLGLQAEKILSTHRLVKTGEALEHVFQKHVRLPNDFDALDLLEGDREFILYYLRGVTHGNEYEFVITCPHCGQVSDQAYDLNDLWETARLPKDDLGEEPFKVLLPHLSEIAGEDFWVSVRFLRGRDVMDFLGVSGPIHEQRKARNKRKNRAEAVDAIRERGENLDETLERNINRVIVDAMGDTDRFKIKALVQRMNSADISAILTFLTENSPGIDNSIETECGNPQCNVTLTVPLPITEEFFRPKRRKGTRK